MRLPVRLRKFIGMLLLLIVLFFYAMIIMTIAVSEWMPANGFIEFMFYLITGLAWTFPAGIIIWWMQKPKKTDRDVA
jgi:peptidoglycan/LPS O-acetylase OafA/YrhL